MALTINIDGYSNGIRGQDVVTRLGRNIGQITGTITFDSDYAEGGEPLTTGITDDDGKGTNLADFFHTRNSTVSSILEIDLKMENGYTAVLDTSTPGSETLRVYNPHVPPIVHEEAFDAADDTANLKYPAAHIEYVASEANPFAPIFSGVTPTSGMYAADIGYSTTTGVHTQGTRPVLTFASGEGIALTYGAGGAFATGMVCSYVTQAWKDVVDNMESCKLDMDGSGVTAATPANHWNPSTATWASDTLDLGVDIIAVTSHTWNNGGTISVPITVIGGAGTVTAATDIKIDFIKAGSAEILYLAADATETDGDTIYVQYIKRPATLSTAGGFLAERFRNANISDSTDNCIWTANPLMYATCGQIPSSATAKAHDITSMFDTVASLKANWQSETEKPNSSGTANMVSEAGTDTAWDPAWIEGAINEIETQAIEVPGHDYSGLGAMRFKAVGYIR